jgi:hypothetical protein
MSLRRAVRILVSGLPEQLRQLCELASKEMDAEKLFALLAEIDRLFREWKHARRARPTLGASRRAFT